ncbi:MAG: gliding motility-associated C-terminal domain-containing protein [Flavobacteriales bacterium]|nr:gliding motility-associated C-terminal domain-containing protein [Flavobacteriales bacterium]MBP9079665.1 gliding motility-associated C-terminal domain-containing protein [Flavobacteriales bacterium]
MSILNARITASTLLSVLLAWGARAQPVCFVQLGADTTICQGGTATLHGPPGYANYLWSNGTTSQNTSATTAGNYWCQVSYATGNLVYNGDFLMGNSGFTSQFIYSTSSVQNEGYYAVGTDAHDYHSQFQGTGTGNFLIANAGYGSWSNNQFDVWCQTIPCCPGQTYTLSFLGRTLSNALPARVVWLMSGQLVNWPDFTFPAYSAGWQTFTTTWTAGPGQTSVNACISVTSGDGVGDDFGIDNISIASTVVLRDTVAVNVTPLPVVDLGPSQSLCAGDVLTLDATVGGGTYAWQDGSINPTFHVTGPGHYSVVVTAQGCSNSDVVNITYNPLPTVDLGPDTLLCAGSPLVLNAYSPGYTYLWQNGSSASTYTVTQPGTYWVEVMRNNCTARDTVQVGYKPMPTVFLGNDTTLCAGDTLALDATVANATCLWENGSTSPLRTLSAAGTYQVAVDLNGCVAQDAIQVSVAPLPTANLGPDQTVCPGTSVTLDATLAGATYLWNDGSTAATLTTVQPGNYIVEVSMAGCSNTDTLAVAHFTLQTVDLGPDVTICAGTSTVLGDQVPGATLLWSTGATTDSITATTGGPYWMQTTRNGCIVSDTVQLTVVPLPIFSLGPDLMVCPGALTTLDATTGNATYLWNNGTNGPTIIAGVGTWSVEVSGNGCSTRDTVTISAYTPPVVDLGPDTVLCPGASITLNAGVPGTYLWNTGATTPSISIGSTMTASLTVTDGHGCQGTDQIGIAFAQPGTTGLGPDSTFCMGNPVMLDATTPGATAYLWNNGSTNALLQANAGGTYWVHVTVGPCSVGDTILLTAAPLPTVDLGTDLLLCPGGSLFLQPPSAGLLLHWQDGSTGSSLLVSAPGSYSVEATNALGCTASDTVVVSGIPAPVVQLGPDTALCPMQSLAVDATVPGGLYLWNDGNTSAQRLLAPGTWSVQVTANSCTASDTITILALPAPVLGLPTDTTLCAGQAWTIDVGQPNSSYLWSTGSTDPSIAVSTPGTYSVDVVREGCLGSASVAVEVVDLSAFSLGPDTMLCPGTSLTLVIPVAGASVVWQDGSTNPNYSITAPGTYQAAISLAGCTAQSSIAVAYSSIPAVDLGPDRHACTGDTVWLTAEVGLAAATWSGGTSGNSLPVTTTGIYFLQLEQDGCTESDLVSILFDPVMDVLDLGPDGELCFDQSIVLDATTAGAQYQWNNGTLLPTLVVDRPGTYAVTITGPCILATDTVRIVEGSCAPLVHIPNAFTPNGDAINDLFMALASEPVDHWKLMVFDRWGLQVFGSSDPQEGWDGMYLGREVPIGVYVWDLHYRKAASNGVVQVRERGSVTLVR